MMEERERLRVRGRRTAIAVWLEVKKEEENTRGVRFWELKGERMWGKMKGGAGHVPCVWPLKWSSWADARKGEGRADGPAQPEEREKEKKERKKKKLAGSCARLENGLRIVAPKPTGLMQSGRAWPGLQSSLFFLNPNLIQHHLLSTFILLLFNFHSIYKTIKTHQKSN